MANIGHLHVHRGGAMSGDRSRHHHQHHGSFASRTPGHPDYLEGGDRAPVDWNDLLPRQIVGVCGGFVAAIGVAATLIVGHPGFLQLAAAGAAIAACGFAAEIGQALATVGRRLLHW
jgi:hypothetical protein